jgi:phage N-6-adenine-methyltransferase
MANDLWRTPKEVFKYFNDRYDFECDVAASDDNHLCDSYYTKKDDALTVDWGNCYAELCDGDYVWCNPPYSNPLPWVHKIIKESQENGIGTVMLLNCDLSVEWSSLLVNLECKIIHPIASGSKKDKTYCNGRIAFLNENNQPVAENNKAQVLFIIPPYVRTGEPVTRYLPLVDIMGAT